MEWVRAGTAVKGRNNFAHSDICSECNADMTGEKVLMVGEPLDHDSATAYLCLECAAKVCVKVRDAE